MSSDQNNGGNNDHDIKTVRIVLFTRITIVGGKKNTQSTKYFEHEIWLDRCICL